MTQSHKLLLSILIIALMLRLGFILGTRAYINPETVEAGAIAHALYIGKGFSMAAPGSSEYYPTAIQAPVFPILLGGMYLLFGENDRAYLILELLQTLLSLWLCYLIYRIGKMAFNKTTGLIAAGIAAVYPVFIIYSGRTTNTMISTVAIAWFLYLLIRIVLPLTSDKTIDNKGSTTKLSSFVYLGLSAGLAILAEPIMLSYVILCYVGYILVKIRNQKSEKMQSEVRSPKSEEKETSRRTKDVRLRTALVVTILITMAVVLPWTVRNAMVFHKFIPVRTMVGINLWQGNNPQATGTDLLPDGRPMYVLTPPEYIQSQIPEPERDAIMVQLAKQYIISHPGETVRLFLKKIYYFWWFPPGNLVSPAAAQYSQLMRFPFALLLIFAGLGTGYAFKNKRYSILILFWLLFIIYTTVYGMTHSGHFRYRAPIEPYIIILAAYGLVSAVQSVQSKRKT